MGELQGNGNVQFTATSSLYSADSPTWDVLTGDMDIRVSVHNEGTWGAANTGFVERWRTSATEDRSWFFCNASATALRFWHSTDGTFANALSQDSAAHGLANSQYVHIRVTLDVDDGAGNHVVTFYKRDATEALDLPLWSDARWTQISSHTVAGTRSVHAGASSVGINGFNSDTGTPASRWAWRTKGVVVINGIGWNAGTQVLGLDFRDGNWAQLSTTDTATDEEGRYWNDYGTITWNQSTQAPVTGITGVEVLLPSGVTAATAHELQTGTVDAADSYIRMASTAGIRYGYFRFCPEKLAQGDTVNKAYINFRKHTGSTTADFEIAGYDIDEATDVTTGAGAWISTTAWAGRTTETVTVAAQAMSSTEESELDEWFDVTAIIQEIVDRPGYKTGNPIAIVVKSTASYDFNVFSRSNGGEGTCLYLSYGGKRIAALTSLDESSGYHDNISWYNYTSYNYVDNTGLAAWRVGPVYIDQAEEVLSATLHYREYLNSGSAGITFTLSGHDADNAGNFTSRADVTGRTRTTANVTGLSSGATYGNAIRSTDVTAIVQEIVDRGAWASGNHIAFLMDKTAGSGTTSGFWGKDGFNHGMVLLEYELAADAGGGGGATRYFAYYSNKQPLFSGI